MYTQKSKSVDGTNVVNSVPSELVLMCQLRNDWPPSVLQRHQSTQAHYQFLPCYLATAVVNDKQNEAVNGCLYDEGDRNLTPLTGITLSTIDRLS